MQKNLGAKLLGSEKKEDLFYNTFDAFQIKYR